MPRKSSSPAAASAAAEQPPLRRKVTLACMVCRKKKVKCNGVQPACARCQSMGLQCQYSDPPKKRGPPKGYVEVINSRARRIESLLSNSGVYRPMMNTNANTTACSFPLADTPVTTATSASSYDHHHHHHHHSSSSSSSGNSSSGNSSSNSNYHHCQQPCNDILKLVAECVPTSLHHHHHHHHQQQQQQQQHTNSPDSHTPLYDFYPNDGMMLMSALGDDEPTADLMLTWADSFFTHFNVFFPILARQHFLHQLVHERPGMNPLLRAAVYALGCHFLNPQDRTGRVWYDRCQALLLSTAARMSHDAPRLSTVQALVIMCWHAYLLGDLEQCHSLRQQLGRTASSLATVQGRTSPTTTVEQELVRRAVWVAHVANQWLSVCTGDRVVFGNLVDGYPLPKLEDCQLHAIDCRTLQPPIIDAGPTVESAFQVAVFAEMAKLASIVQRATFQTVNKTDLAEWLFNLPSYLDCSVSAGSPAAQAPSPVARVFHMLYHTVLIVLNQADDTIEARNICSTSANTILHLAEQMVSTSPDQKRHLYNVFGLSITLAATVHLHLARSFDPRIHGPAKINLGKSMRVIRSVNPTAVPHLDALLGQQIATRYAVFLDDHNPDDEQPSDASNQTRCSGFKRSAAELDDDSSLLNYQLHQAKRPCVFGFDTWLPLEQEQQVIISPCSSATLDDTASLIDLFSIPGWDQQAQHATPFSINSTSPSLSPQLDATPSPTATCFSPNSSPSLLSMNQLQAFVKQEHGDLLDSLYLQV